MAYMRNDLISRPGYAGVSGMGDWWDTISDAAGSVLKVYNTGQQAAGAATAAQQTNRDLAAALAAQQGISTSTIVLLGAAGLAAVLLLKK